MLNRHSRRSDTLSHLDFHDSISFLILLYMIKPVRSNQSALDIFQLEALVVLSAPHSALLSPCYTHSFVRRQAYTHITSISDIVPAIPTIGMDPDIRWSDTTPSVNNPYWGHRPTTFTFTHDPLLLPCWWIIWGGHASGTFLLLSTLSNSAKGLDWLTGAIAERQRG